MAKKWLVFSIVAIVVLLIAVAIRSKFKGIQVNPAPLKPDVGDPIKLHIAATQFDGVHLRNGMQVDSTQDDPNDRVIALTVPKAIASSIRGTRGALKMPVRRFLRTVAVAHSGRPLVF